MSECVVRMEMPENCQRCELFALCTGKCKNEVVRFDGKNIDKKDRRCLFVCQLPEGHGRLIDASTVIGFIDEKDNDIPVTVDDYIGLYPSVHTIVPAEAERSET